MNYSVQPLYARILSFTMEKQKSLKFRLFGSFLGVSIWLCLSFAAFVLLGTDGILLTSALPLFVGGYLLLAVIQRLEDLSRQRVYDERANQALTAIYRALDPKAPLPYFRSVALSADSCLDYIRLIKQNQPEVIVELGCGSSTIVAGYQLKLNGKGRILAIDHDEIWGGITSSQLEEHDLTDCAEVRIASLKEVDVKGQPFNWYDPTKLEDVEDIDILLIDGPPDYHGLGTRYPGLTLMADRVKEDGVIIVDDCVMPRWKKIVVEWAFDNGFFVESRFLNEKDTLFLHRRGTGRDKLDAC